MRILSPITLSPPFDILFGSLLSGYYPPFATYADCNPILTMHDNRKNDLIDPNGITTIRDNQNERIIDPNNRNSFEYRG